MYGFKVSKIWKEFERGAKKLKGGGGGDRENLISKRFIC
jgi:hypothetical protein